MQHFEEMNNYKTWPWFIVVLKRARDAEAAEGIPSNGEVNILPLMLINCTRILSTRHRKFVGTCNHLGLS